MQNKMWLKLNNCQSHRSRLKSFGPDFTFSTCTPKIGANDVLKLLTSPFLAITTFSGDHTGSLNSYHMHWLSVLVILFLMVASAFLRLQGVCALEGEEHSHRAAGFDPQSCAPHARVPEEHEASGTASVHTALHRHHHQEIWYSHPHLGHTWR